MKHYNNVFKNLALGVISVIFSILMLPRPVIVGSPDFVAGIEVSINSLPEYYRRYINNIPFIVESGRATYSSPFAVSVSNTALNGYEYKTTTSFIVHESCHIYQYKKLGIFFDDPFGMERECLQVELDYLILVDANIYDICFYAVALDEQYAYLPWAAGKHCDIDQDGDCDFFDWIKYRN